MSKVSNIFLLKYLLKLVCVCDLDSNPNALVDIKEMLYTSSLVQNLSQVCKGAKSLKTFGNIGYLKNNMSYQRIILET